MKIEILSYIGRGEGTVTWYQIGRAMSECEIARDGKLMAYIDQILEDGLIRAEVKEGYPL